MYGVNDPVDTGIFTFYVTDHAAGVRWKMMEDKIYLLETNS